MDNISDNITNIWTFQDLSKQVSKISTSWHPANLDLATGHCFTNGMLADIKMSILESIFRHGETIDHQLIFYIHVSG